jgi:tetratricopeptide (TPR) repeat protein
MRGTPVERALIEAAYVRYTDPQPEDRSALDRLYATKMRAVWHRFPKDTDVGALFAESMMDLRPWDLWQKSGSPQPGTTEILATLDHVLAQNPKHPGAVHYLIHALEASPRAGDATRAADILRTLMPSAGHMVHMPSHIDVRTGQWGKAVIANEKAIVADAEYRKAHNKIGLYRVYMSHNYHMLSLAAMMLGQSKKAIGALDRMVAIIPPDFAQENAAFIDGFMAMPLEVRKRFGNWDEILSAPDFPDYFPIARSMRHMDRAIAYAAKGMPSEARAEQSLFFMARKKVPAEAFFGNNKASDILSVAAHLMNGEILVAEDRMDDACAELRVAVDAESALRYSEPPDWIIPTRHTLGAVLVKSERFDEAVEVYRADLKEYPNDGWALYGLSQALAGQGKHPEAARVRSRFDTMWANADVQISSSCMCLPGGNRRP